MSEFFSASWELMQEWTAFFIYRRYCGDANDDTVEHQRMRIDDVCVVYGALAKELD